MVDDVTYQNPSNSSPVASWVNVLLIIIQPTILHHERSTNHQIIINIQGYWFLDSSWSIIIIQPTIQTIIWPSNNHQLTMDWPSDEPTFTQHLINLQSTFNHALSNTNRSTDTCWSVLRAPGDLHVVEESCVVLAWGIYNGEWGKRLWLARGDGWITAWSRI